MTKVDSKHSFTSFQQLIEGASRIRTNDIDVRYGIGNFLFFISLRYIYHAHLRHGSRFYL